MNKYKEKILAVDFDDTLVSSSYPNILNPKMKVVNFVKKFKNNGGYIILNTCRHNKELTQAVEYCTNELGIIFDKVNENLDEEIAKYGDSRKIFAHYYLDDKAMKIDDILTFDEV